MNRFGELTDEVKFFARTCKNLKANEINTFFNVLAPEVREGILNMEHSKIAEKAYAMRELGIQEGVQSLVDYGNVLFSSIGVLPPKE